MLRGKQVVLRPFRDDDLAALYSIWADFDSWAARSSRPPQPLTLSAFRNWYLPATSAFDGDVEFVVEVEDEVIGRCGMFNEDPLARHAEIGIALATSAQGKGHGTDALRTLVDFLFSARNLHRLHLETLAGNAAALASYRKVGFVAEGVLRQHAYANGEYVDMVVMGLLRSEWQVG